MKAAATSFKGLPLRDIVDTNLQQSLKNLNTEIQKIQQDLAAAINANEISYIAAAAQPTPIEGQWMIWKNTAAGAGTPKAFIVTTQGGATYTFASKELA